MKILNPKVKSAFDGDSRQIKIKATFNDKYVVDGEHIISAEITDTMCSTSTLSLGNTCSNELQMEMYVPDNFVGLENAKIKLEFGIVVDGNTEYTPIGVYYVDSVSTTNNYKSVTIKAYDAMLKLNALGNTYTCKLGADKVRATSVILDIAEQAGIVANVKTKPETLTITEDCKAEAVSYNSNGDEVQADLFYGIGKNNLVRIPPYTKEVEWRMFSSDGYNDPLQVCLFRGALGTNLLTYNEYSGFQLSQFVDINTGEEYITCTLLVPSLPYETYLGFSLKGNDAEKSKANTYKIITKYYESMVLVNTDKLLPNPGFFNVSPRAMVGYMAGLLGGNAKINANDELVIAPYTDTNYTIGLGQYFQNGFQKEKQNPLSVDYLTTGTEKDSNGNGGAITVGSGEFGFNFTNPYIDKTDAQNILNLYSDIKLTPATLKNRGNIAYESGDIVYVKDKDSTLLPVLICSQTISFKGGMSTTIDGNITTDGKATFISTPSTKTLTQVFSDFNEKYQNIVSMFTGVNGGYVKFVYDAQNKMRAIAIPDADIELKWDNAEGKVVTANGSTNVAMWVWNNGALGYTPNGGKTYATALTKDGKIFADGILSYTGTIGGFNIDSEALWADNGNYRTYVQSAVIGDKSWAFSVQQKESDGYHGRWWITSNGEQHCYNGIYLEHNDSNIYDASGNLILAPYQDGALVIGYGYYDKNYRTYIEGGAVYLVAHDGNKNRTIFTFTANKWTDGVIKSTINVDRDLGIEVPDGKAVFVNCDGGMYIYGLIHADGMLSSSDVTVSGAIEGNSLDIAGESHLRGKTYVNWRAASAGLAPLYVDQNGLLQSSTSSARYKKDISTEFSEDLDPHKLYDLPVKQYQYKDEHKDKQLVEGMQVGLIAEDVDKYYPNACQYNDDGEPESWRERIVLPAMLKLIQEQKAEIDELRARLDKIEKSKE
jgi:hypothetical protein